MSSQCERVLNALRSRPVTPLSFSLPYVVDGGPPIGRLAARIQDLRDAGHEIQSSRTPSNVASYRLVREAGQGDRVSEDERAVAATPNVPVALTRAAAPGAPHAAPEGPSSSSPSPTAAGANLFNPDEYTATPPTVRALHHYEEEQAA